MFGIWQVFVFKIDWLRLEGIQKDKLYTGLVEQCWKGHEQVAEGKLRHPWRNGFLGDEFLDFLPLLVFVK